jgi:hypothetical protein
LKRFNNAGDQRPSSSDSLRSILQADDWRQIERLLKNVVADVYDKNTKKLSATIYQLIIQNTLLNLCCEGLETALLNEKKKRQYKKLLLFQLQASEDYNAVFYSPRKAQQA